MAAPSAFARLQDYERRSIAHVAAAPEVSEEPGHWRAVAYRLGPHLLVSAFDQVIEITGIPPMTPVTRVGEDMPVSMLRKPWTLGRLATPGQAPRNPRAFETNQSLASVFGRCCGVKSCA